MLAMRLVMLLILVIVIIVIVVIIVVIIIVVLVLLLFIVLAMMLLMLVDHFLKIDFHLVVFKLDARQFYFRHFDFKMRAVKGTDREITLEIRIGKREGGSLK